MTLPIDPATGLQLPVGGASVTQFYGPELTDPDVRHLYRKGYHTGIDFGGVAEGTPVLSPSDGTVVLAGTNGGYGECVVVSRGDGIEVLFGHLCRIDVQPGQLVAVGQAIGGIGTTGVSTGVHLHLEYRRQGEDIDPTPFLRGGGLEEAATPSGRLVLTTADLKLRERPDQDAAVLAVAPAGAVVSLRRDAYFPVRWNGHDGWLWGAYLDLDAGSTAVAFEDHAPAAADALVANRRGHTTTDLYLRTGPGTDFAVLNLLPPDTIVDVQDEQGDWLHTRAGGEEGYVHRDFVSFAQPAAHGGLLRERPDLASVPLAPTAAARIAAAVATDSERLVADTWNRYGGLLTVLAEELSIDSAIAVAVLAVEAGGRAFGDDGRMIIRFENHIFYDEWGARSSDAFARYFRFGADAPWQGHLWRPSSTEPWREFHGDQQSEWQVFELACGLDDTAAKRAISMGAPQIMGFNHSGIGFATVQEMFDAFSRSEHAQLTGFFDFVRGASANSSSLQALQQRDFQTFATLYNGAGQAATYATLIENACDVFHRLRAV
jgi:uncharacterized protein YraI